MNVVNQKAYDDLPELNINTTTGFGAKLRPLLTLIPPSQKGGIAPMESGSILNDSIHIRPIPYVSKYIQLKAPEGSLRKPRKFKRKRVIISIKMHRFQIDS